jgi:hypothetical protein
MCATSILSPERWINTEFIDGLNDAAKVMAEHLTKHFVSLRAGRFVAEAFAKLRLDHVRRRLDVAAPVVVSHEALLVNDRSEIQISRSSVYAVQRHPEVAGYNEWVSLLDRQLD